MATGETVLISSLSELWGSGPGRGSEDDSQAEMERLRNINHLLQEKLDKMQQMWAESEGSLKAEISRLQNAIELYTMLSHPQKSKDKPDPSISKDQSKDQSKTIQKPSPSSKSQSDWDPMDTVIHQRILSSFLTSFLPSDNPSDSILLPPLSSPLSSSSQSLFSSPSLPLSALGTSVSSDSTSGGSLLEGLPSTTRSKKSKEKREIRASPKKHGTKDYHKLLADSKMGTWIDGALHCIKPSKKGEQRRLGVLSFIRCVVRKSLGAQVYPHGRFALKTYFPDDEIDVSAFFSQAHESTWIQKLINGLCQEADEDSHSDSRDPLYAVKRVEIIFSKTTTLVKCRIGGLTVNIFDNQLSALGSAALYECVDQQCGKDHLFKRCILLVTAWGRRCGILGTHKGLLSHDCLRALVFYLFNAYHSEIRTPLEGFYKLLKYLEKFEWDTQALTAYGPIELSSLIEAKPEPITEGLKTWPSGWEPLIPPETLRKYIVKNNRRKTRSKIITKSQSAPRSLSSLSTSPSHLSPSLLEPTTTTTSPTKKIGTPQMHASASSGALFALGKQSLQPILESRTQKSTKSRLRPTAKVFTSKQEDPDTKIEQKQQQQQKAKTPESNSRRPSDAESVEGEMRPTEFLRCSINVLDPVDPSRNLGATVSYKNEFKIRRAFAEGATELRAALQAICDSGVDLSEVRAESHPILKLIFPEDILVSFQNKRFIDMKLDALREDLETEPEKRECECTDKEECTFCLTEKFKKFQAFSNSSPASLTPIVTPPPAMKRSASASALYGQDSGSESKSDMSFGILDGNLERMMQNLAHAKQFQTPDISEEELVLLIKNILIEKGSVPVGRMGSLLHEVTNNHSLPAMVKEHYGGLKRLLERHPEEFSIGKDHPYNPHVRLRLVPTVPRPSIVKTSPLSLSLPSRSSLSTSPPKPTIHRVDSLPNLPSYTSSSPSSSLSGSPPLLTHVKSGPIAIPSTTTTSTSSSLPASHSDMNTKALGFQSSSAIPIPDTDSSLTLSSSFLASYEVGETQGYGRSSSATRGRKRRTRTRHTTDRKVITSCLAMDCEMIGVGPLGVGSVLARCTIVNYYGDVVYDKYVKPLETVTDYRTEVSGIEAQHIRNENAVEFKQVQREVAAIIKNRVLIGHSLANDLQVLVLSHPKHLLRDTAHCKLICPHRPLPLKTVVKEILGIDIQTGGHDSIEDARAALNLYKAVRTDWFWNDTVTDGPDVSDITGSGQQSGSSGQQSGSGQQEKLYEASSSIHYRMRR